MNTSPALGSKVYFGRSLGEQTLGEVIKVNRTSALIKQLESRGTRKAHEVGKVWRVPFILLAPAPSGQGGSGNPERQSLQAEIERLRAENERLKAHKRPDALILRDILNVYNSLSPENLSCDGELPGSQIRRRACALNTQLRALFREIGRRVSEEEAYGLVGPRSLGG
jgi:hypothetical protein